MMNLLAKAWLEGYAAKDGAENPYVNKVNPADPWPGLDN